MAFKLSDQRPTLKSLAAITGLGVSTVSRALQDDPKIAKDTRLRVRLAAEQVGYRPNRAGVRLRTGKTNVITLILNTTGSAFGLAEQLVYGISEALEGTSYHLVITPYALDDPMAPVRYVVETQSADGVIISRTQADDPRVRYLMTNNMPFASHGRTDMGLDHAYCDFDNEAFAREAVRMLAARGRKKIGLIRPPPENLFHDHLLRGFHSEVRHTNMQVYDLSDLNIDTPVSRIVTRLQEIAGSADGPDAYISASENSTMAMINTIESTGKKLGHDFDLVTKKSAMFEGWSPRGLLMIVEDHRRAGFNLAQAVIGAIEGKPAHELQTVFAPNSAD
jgi:LacI family transcriptional regulator